ncbi:peroxisome biogenesis factor 10-like isoform X2 [Cimex lectularius]|nr:peroxisome biogenesis factor 10-like isoform X2 [Cimex lectularius]XP_014249340.1 peroxisome biogenesis factor 10-like isoform X2 [Cimex lectularius]
MFEDVALEFGGPRFSMKYKRLISGFSSMFYYYNTTMSGLQTIGEEYTGIVQVNSTLRSIPRYFNRFLMSLFESFGMLMVLVCCKNVEKYIKENNDILPEAKGRLLKMLLIFKSLLPHIDTIHKAYFFCNWGTYHLSQRLTGIHYILSRFWLKDRQSIPAFRVLGGITMIQLLITSTIAIMKNYNVKLPAGESQMVQAKNLSEHRKCAMCLSTYQNPSCTPCGHIFCWNCILEWLQSENQCPICREPTVPSRIVCLKNYF